MKKTPFIVAAVVCAALLTGGAVYAVQNTGYISEAEAQEKALAHAGIAESEATFVHTHLDYDDGRAEYEVEFYKDNIEYDYDIDALTGNIISYDYDAENHSKPVQTSAPVTSTSAPASASDSALGTTAPASVEYIGEADAREKALAHAGIAEADATFVRVHFDYDDGRAEYEVEFYKDNIEYDYDIDALTGDIISYDYDAEYHSQAVQTTAPATAKADTGYISEADALEKALTHAGLTESNVSAVSVEFDYDDGVAEYEIEFRVGSTEYEYDINAVTGEITGYEIDND